MGVDDKVKNNYETRGDVTAIIINSPKYGRKEALISTCKLERAKEFVNSWRLCFSVTGKTFYVVGHMVQSEGKRQEMRLHRWLTNAPDGLEVDHFNHDGLNNIDENLRVVTSADNKQNKKGPHKNSKSGIRGVYWIERDKKYVAKINIDGRRVHLGYFNNISEAERVAVEARKKYMKFSQEASA